MNTKILIIKLLLILIDRTLVTKNLDADQQYTIRRAREFAEKYV